MSRGGEGAAGSEGGREGGDTLPWGSLAVDTRAAPGERLKRWGWGEGLNGARRWVGVTGWGEEAGDAMGRRVAPPGRGRPGPWGGREELEQRSRRGGPPGARGRRVGCFTSKAAFDPGHLGDLRRPEAKALNLSPVKKTRSERRSARKAGDGLGPGEGVNGGACWRSGGGGRQRTGPGGDRGGRSLERPRLDQGLRVGADREETARGGGLRRPAGGAVRVAEIPSQGKEGPGRRGWTVPGACSRRYPGGGRGQAGRRKTRWDD